MKGVRPNIIFEVRSNTGPVETNKKLEQKKKKEEEEKQCERQKY